MSSIVFSENQNSVLVAFEDGTPLCSVVAPQEQGLKWAYSLGALPTKHVVVIGLGSGYHISALAEIDPSLKITVIDNRETLLSVFQAQFSSLSNQIEIQFIEKADDILKADIFREIVDDHAFILSFRECWGCQSQIFSEVFAHVTGRSVDSLNYHFENFGFNIKARSAVGSGLLSIKDVLPVIENSSIEESKKQGFRVLGELIK